MKNLVLIIAAVLVSVSVFSQSPDYSLYYKVDFDSPPELDEFQYYTQPDGSICYYMRSYTDSLAVKRVLVVADYLLSTYNASTGLDMSDFFDGNKEIEELEYVYELPDGGLMRVGREELVPGRHYPAYVSVVYADGKER